MQLLKVQIQNPITIQSVDAFIVEISEWIKANHDASKQLIVNFGDHNFCSFDVIKYCKNQLKLIEPSLLQFHKIAFVHPPQYSNSSDNEKLNYFTSDDEALKWLEK